MKVLVIEQDKTLLQSLAFFLGQHKNWEVTLAHSRQEGLALLESSTFGIVLCGDRLPDGDGLQILQGLDREKCQTISILMTARGSEAQREEAMRAGIDGYIEKPFDLRQLEEIMGGSPS